MSDDRITTKDVYEVLMGVKRQIGGIEGKLEMMIPDLATVKITIEKHAEKIGLLRGTAATWGIIGGAIITVIGGIVLYIVTHGFRPAG
jgi:hypothetical protein